MCFCRLTYIVRTHFKCVCGCVRVCLWNVPSSPAECRFTQLFMLLLPFFIEKLLFVIFTIHWTHLSTTCRPAPLSERTHSHTHQQNKEKSKLWLFWAVDDCRTFTRNFYVDFKSFFLLFGSSFCWVLFQLIGKGNAFLCKNIICRSQVLAHVHT